MNDLKREYNEAMIDIEIYCKHLEELENQKNYSQLSKTMKGNLFLMLYNVIESIITKSLILIHNTINDEKIRVEECIDQIKDLWIKFERKKQPSNATTDSSLLIVSGFFNIQYKDYQKKIKTNKISGNLDARKIRNISSVYGLPHNTQITGKKLLIIKHNRNILAHGEKSFSELGRIYSQQDINKYYKECNEFLNEYILNLETYIREKKYKKLTI
jgi:hypothetical protein